MKAESLQHKTVWNNIHTSDYSVWQFEKISWREVRDTVSGIWPEENFWREWQQAGCTICCFSSAMVSTANCQWMCKKRISDSVKIDYGRTLARRNYFKSVPQRVPLMTAENKRKREASCIVHQNYNFDNVIFTDESRFQLYRCTRKRWAKFGHCQKMVPKFSPAVTVWGGISKLGLTPLVSVSRNISAIKYCKFWGEGLLLSNIVTNDLPYVLQQDNARPHTATYTRG